MRNYSHHYSLIIYRRKNIDRLTRYLVDVNFAEFSKLKCIELLILPVNTDNLLDER